MIDKKTLNADFKYFSDLKCLQLKNTSFDWVEDAVSASITFPSILNLKELLYQSLPEQTRAYMYAIVPWLTTCKWQIKL